jgi:hypothetical protein
MGELKMLLTNEEVLDIVDERLDLSDFNNWYGKSDDMVEFAYAIVKAEMQKRYELDLLRNTYFSESMDSFDELTIR